jgi:hypothetical protein
MSRKQVEVKVFEYNQDTDTFNITVNDEAKQIPASQFAEQHQAMQDNIAAEYSKPQLAEDYCLAMIFDMHFNEEPSDLCYTFYRVLFDAESSR